MDRILGIDTSTAHLSVAVTAGDEVLAERLVEPDPAGRPRHAREVLGAVEEVLTDGGGWEAIGRIAVGTGPGTFTGLRVGIATARGLAQSRGLGISGVSSLRALASGSDSSGPVLAVLDAKRSEVFAALYDGSEEIWAPAVHQPEGLAEKVREQGFAVTAVGDGAVRFRGEMEASGAQIPPDDAGVHRVRARYVCLHASGGDPGPLADIKPTYLRKPDAELWRERDRGTTSGR